MDDNNPNSLGARLWGLPKPPPRKPRRAKPLERTIKKQIETALNRLPGVHVDVVTVALVTLPSGQKAQVGLPGQGDLVGTVEVVGLGVHCEVEVKRPGEVQRKSQEKREARLRSRGACYLVATSAAEAVARLQRWREQAEAALRARGLR